MKPEKFLNIIKSRRSIRKFKPYKISKKEILMILEAARWAPSGVNSQPWKFIVVTNKKLIEKISKVSETLGTYEPQELKNAACMIGVIKTDKKGRHTDIGLAMENIILQAHVMGLGSCIIGAVEKNVVAKLLKIPEDRELCYIIPIGKPAEKPVRTRKKLNEIAFLNVYGKGLKNENKA